MPTLTFSAATGPAANAMAMAASSAVVIFLMVRSPL